MQPDSAQATFWRWFRDNGERLRASMYGPDPDAREGASDELREAVAAVGPGLILEFGPGPEGGPNPLIVSADGRPERVDAVKEFVAAAPELPGWEVVAFRPRMEIGDNLEIALADQRVGAGDVWFRVAEGEDGLDLTLHVRGLSPDNQRLRGLGASLLAEHAVGERDAITLIDSLRVEPLPEDPAAAGLRPFGELVGVFDATRRKKYPPPGSLPLDPEGDWQGLRGTIDGADAFVLLNAGLRPLAGHPDYDRRLVVTVPFNQARADGMPATEKEFIAVGELGDRLDEALREGQQSLLALTIMTRGRRELVLYTSDAEGARRRLDELRANVETHRVEDRVEWDSFWGMYRSFCRAAAPDDAEE